MTALRIVNWDRHYENNRSRELKRPEWFPLPNSFNGARFMELMDHPAGMSHYAAWCLLLAVASQVPRRGLLVSDSGRPYTLKDIARMTRGSAKVFEEALPRLLDLGWIEEIEEKSGISSDSIAPGEDAGGTEVAGKSQDGAGIPQEPAGKPPLNRKGNEKGKGGGTPPPTTPEASVPDLIDELRRRGCKVHTEELVAQWKAVCQGITSGQARLILEQVTSPVLYPPAFAKERARWQERTGWVPPAPAAVKEPPERRRTRLLTHWAETRRRAIEKMGDGWWAKNREAIAKTELPEDLRADFLGREGAA